MRYPRQFKRYHSFRRPQLVSFVDGNRDNNRATSRSRAAATEISGDVAASIHASWQWMGVCYYFVVHIYLNDIDTIAKDRLWNDTGALSSVVEIACIITTIESMVDPVFSVSPPAIRSPFARDDCSNYPITTCSIVCIFIRFESIRQASVDGYCLSLSVYFDLSSKNGLASRFYAATVSLVFASSVLSTKSRPRLWFRQLSVNKQIRSHQPLLTEWEWREIGQTLWRSHNHFSDAAWCRHMPDERMRGETHVCLCVGVSSWSMKTLFLSLSNRGLTPVFVSIRLSLLTYVHTYTC